MVRKEFEIWLINLFFNLTLVIVDIYITNLGNLKDKPLCFTKLSDSNMDESNRILIILDIVAIIPVTKN